MSKFENELINNPINAHGPTNEFKLGVRGIVEDEIMLIEMGQLSATYATSHLIVVISSFFFLSSERTEHLL